MGGCSNHWRFNGVCFVDGRIKGGGGLSGVTVVRRRVDVSSSVIVVWGQGDLRRVWDIEVDSEEHSQEGLENWI